MFESMTCVLLPPHEGNSDIDISPHQARAIALDISLPTAVGLGGSKPIASCSTNLSVECKMMARDIEISHR